ncbi:hypothetical protein EFL91_03180 [Fructilactobacillus fructivorans]|uniref:YfhO family protein n=1 Tax=Fructilactobacillus fructivorans TaxID=1614 RepID=UPI00223AD43C|nr:YfhO family protein [Fructilactobacillus fructivorans]MCT0151529.1 hypothetical protein [Fructilactobacillus fructivorans]
MNKVIKKCPAWLFYSLIFFVITMVYVWTFYLTGNSLIWGMDGIAQHYPILINFKHMLSEFLTNPSRGFTNWSFNIGLGADQLTSFSYYVVGDFFNYLIVLFPDHLLELGYGLLVILRLYIAGLAFLLFAHQFNFKKISLVLGTLTYTFAGYSLYAGMHHPFFILPMIFFPLICYGVERIIRNHSMMPLMLAVALTFLSNFYFAYIIGLGSIIYVIIRYLSIRKDPDFHFVRSVVKMGAAILTGILISAVIFVPTLLFAMKSTRITSNFANGYLFYPLYYYLSIPSKILGNGYLTISFWLIISISGLSFLGIVYTLSHFKKYRYLNYGLIIVFIGALIPAFGAVFNAISTPSNRWVCLGLLPIGLAATIFAEHISTLSKRDLEIMIGATIGLIIVIWAFRGFIMKLSAHDYGEIILLLVLVGIILCSQLFHWDRRLTMGSVTGLLVVNLISLGVGYYSPNVSGFSKGMLNKQVATNFVNNFYNGANKYVEPRLNGERTALGNRYHYAGRNDVNLSNYSNVNTNIPMLFGTHDISSYLTVENGAIGQLESSVQNNQRTFNAPVAQNDYRTTLDNLMGVKYLFIRNGQQDKSQPFGFKTVKGKGRKPLLFTANNPLVDDKEPDGTIVLQNKNALPLAYTQEQTVSDKQYQALSPTEREQSMISGAHIATPVRGIPEAKLNDKQRQLDYEVKPNYEKTLDNFDKLTTFTNNSKRVEYSEPSINHTSPDTAQKILDENVELETETQKQNADGLHVMTKDVLGKPIPYLLKLKQPNRTKNAELYLQLDGIKSHDYTTDAKNAMVERQHAIKNEPYTRMMKLNQMRKNLHTPFVDQYSFNAATKGMKNGYSQYGRDNLSNYAQKKNVLINLGYSPKRRGQIKLTFDGVSRLNFKHARLIAVPFGNSYEQQIHKLQRNRLQKLRVKRNEVQGISTNPKKSVLTTSIPYSPGWKLTVDGKSAPTQRVNTGFVGAILQAGKHQIRLRYQTPGLIIGSVASVIGILILIISSIVIWIFKKRK